MLYGTYDLETYGLGGEIAGIGSYDGKDFHSFDTVDALLDFFEKSSIKTWYAHNGGKYDLKYLFEAILNRYVVDITDIHGNYGCVKAYRSQRTRRRTDKKTGKIKVSIERTKQLFELRDSILLLPGSLKSLSYAFDIEHKKQDYEDYEEHRDRERMYEYLKYDCIALYEILHAFALGTGIDDFCLTTAGTAMKVFREQFGGAEWLKLTGRYCEKYREGYYGGRTEVFTRYGEDLFYYDINSLYPSVMYDNDYPIGPVLGTHEFMPDSCGYYKCRITAPGDLLIPLLPVRNEGKLTFPLGTWEGWYYSPEIKEALRVGYKVQILKGLYWEETINPFTDYIDHYYTIKRNNTGAMRYIAKLLLNSLYGKFAQRSTGIKKYDIRNMDPEDILEKGITPYPLYDDIGYAEEQRGYSNFIRPQIAGLTTSYARLKLYEYMGKIGHENIYYCDTDSIVSDVPLSKGIGKELGEMKLEDRIKRGIFLLPKVYAYESASGEYVIKAKGLDASKLCYDDYVPALSGDYSQLTTSVMKVAGFNEKLRRGIEGPFYSTIQLHKDISGTFNKRILMEDNIHTLPLYI